MLANPETGVDTTATFSALNEATEPPAEQTAESTETTENLETTSETPTLGITKPTDETGSQDNQELKSFTIKRNGEEIELFTRGELDEALPSELMMTSTFYKKTEELANDRKALEAKTSELDKTLADMRNHLDFEISQLESKEMLELKENDPGEYWERYGALQDKVNSFKKFSDQRQGELQAQQQEIMKKEISNWPTAIPEWQNEDVMKEETGGIYSMLSKEGFTDEQISNIYDSKIVKLMRKAMLYDKAAAKVIEPKPKTPQKHVKSNSIAESKPKEEKTLEEVFYGGG